MSGWGGEIGVHYCSICGNHCYCSEGNWAVCDGCPTCLRLLRAAHVQEERNGKHAGTTGGDTKAKVTVTKAARNDTEDRSNRAIRGNCREGKGAGPAPSASLGR